MTYEILSLGSSTSPVGSLISFDQISGDLKIISNSIFTLILNIKVTASYSTSSNYVTSNSFQIQMIDCLPTISYI